MTFVYVFMCKFRLFCRNCYFENFKEMRPLRVIFLHPDLGIGGAERLVVDSALALKSRGHTIRFLTSHHDPGHCFTETKDGTLDVRVVGDFLPRRIFGRFNAFFAYLRTIYTAIYLLFFSGWQYDLIFVDQISAAIPLLKSFSKSKIIFYCHFPDQLLTQRRNLLKKLYRKPIDFLEEWSTGMADCILVNSKFTGESQYFLPVFDRTQYIFLLIHFFSRNL